MDVKHHAALDASLIEKTPDSGKKRLPAEEGVWVFIVGDMLIFSAFFLVFAFYRNQDIALFTESQQLLDANLGALNTLLLLTSSWFVAMGLRAARNNMRDTAARFIMLAGLCGVGFVVVKFFEWGAKIDLGLLLTTNDFFMYYYIFTGIHLIHLLIGLGVLLLVWFKLRAMPEGGYRPCDIQLFEGGAAYWHMVDLLWIVLFPLIYLVK